jgi:hypothetical protein
MAREIDGWLARGEPLVSDRSCGRPPDRATGPTVGLAASPSLRAMRRRGHRDGSISDCHSVPRGVLRNEPKSSEANAYCKSTSGILAEGFLKPSDGRSEERPAYPRPPQRPEPDHLGRSGGSPSMGVRVAGVGEELRLGGNAGLQVKSRISNGLTEEAGGLLE